MVYLHPSAGMIRIRCCGSDQLVPLSRQAPREFE